MENIDNLIYKKLVGTLTDTEQKELDEWLAEDESHREVFDRIANSDKLIARYQQYQSIDSERAWRAFETRHNIRRTRFVWLKRLSAAAVVLAILGVGIHYMMKANDVVKPELSKEIMAAISDSQKAGHYGAMVYGNAEEEETGMVNAKGTMAPGINPTLEQEIEADPEMNADTRCDVVTYHDREYWLTLDDGTRVHLNYDSKLIHPSHFTGDSRTVYLEGEAFFFVAKDSSHPFYVRTPNGEVKEYGTSFNVNTRSENGTTQVVLVEGSIGVTATGGREHMIRPNEMAELGSTGSVKIEKTDVLPYVAWNEGRFVFNDCTLESLMKVMSRWYGKKIDFRDAEAKSIHFSGAFSKYGNIKDMLSAIENVTNLKVYQQGNTIVIE